jgi:hypothetical protein
MLRCMLISMVIGIVSEITARTLRLWIYRSAQTPIVNVIVMFGVVMGGIAALVPSVGLLPAFFIAFAVGLVYEIANLYALDWWYFPGEQLAFIHGHAAIVVVIAVVWGAVPMVTVAVRAALF